MHLQTAAATTVLPFHKLIWIYNVTSHFFELLHIRLGTSMN